VVSSLSKTLGLVPHTRLRTINCRCCMPYFGLSLLAWLTCSCQLAACQPLLFPYCITASLQPTLPIETQHLSLTSCSTLLAYAFQAGREKESLRVLLLICSPASSPRSY